MVEISRDENILLTLGWRFLIIKFRSSVAAHQILFFFFFVQFLTVQSFWGGFQNSLTIFFSYQ